MKRIITLILLFTAISLHAMQPQPARASSVAEKLRIENEAKVRQYEQKYIDALRTGDIATIEAILRASRNGNYIFQQGEWQGNSPFIVLLNVGKYDDSFKQIGDLLFTYGAKKDSMRFGLHKAADQNNLDLVKWFLGHGARDYQNEIVESLEIREYNSRDPQEQKIISEIKREIQNAARTPMIMRQPRPLPAVPKPAASRPLPIPPRQAK